MDTQEARIFIAIIITSVVLGVIIGYFVISVIRQQKRNLALQKTNILAEISAMEKERARIAADLHDDLGPLLSVIKFQVDYARQSEVVESEQLDKASEQLDGLIDRMREIANDLMPSALQRKGVLTAVGEYISKVRKTGKLNIIFQHPPNLVLSPVTSIHIYRTLQEAIHNCMKHAEASEMTIDLEKKNNHLTILCRDNGRGFDQQVTGVAQKGIGLNSLKNRTEILGGTMIIESKPGMGTALLFTIPIK
jgi:signal transduction histidine kinase